MAVVQVKIGANVSAIDLQGSAPVGVMDVDLRQQATAGGSIAVEESGTTLSAFATGACTLYVAQGGSPTVTETNHFAVNGWLTIIDTESGASVQVVNVDLRNQGSGEGGMFSFQVASSSLSGFTSNAACTVTVAQ